MNGGVSVDKDYEMTIVDLNNIGYRNDPFVITHMHGTSSMPFSDLFSRSDVFSFF
jgi:hypothetical protein